MLHCMLLEWQVGAMISHGGVELLFLIIDYKLYKDKFKTTLQGKNFVATKLMGQIW